LSCEGFSVLVKNVRNSDGKAGARSVLLAQPVDLQPDISVAADFVSDSDVFDRPDALVLSIDKKKGRAKRPASEIEPALLN